MERLYFYLKNLAQIKTRSQKRAQTSGHELDQLVLLRLALEDEDVISTEEIGLDPPFLPVFIIFKAQENDEAAFDDSDAEGIPEQKPSGEKIGTKKARKLEEKEARAAQRKFEEEERKKNKEIQEERRAEHLKKLEEEGL